MNFYKARQSRFFSLGEKIVILINQQFKNQRFTKQQIQDALNKTKIRVSKVTLKNTLTTLKKHNFIQMHGLSKMAHYSVNLTTWNPDAIYPLLNRKSMENREFWAKQDENVV